MPRFPAAPSAPTLEAAQSAGFMVGGEPLAVDLADTLVMVTDPPTDLLSDEATSERFWELQNARLPAGWASPSLAATRRLRDAVRQLFDAAQQGRALDPSSLGIVNKASAKTPTALEGRVAGKVLTKAERWIFKTPRDLALAAAARSALDVLAEPTQLGRLRRCANPNCSMLFVNGDARRQWCTPNICGNRARVARHYRRQRQR